jgi:hypothetical protein
MNQTTRIVMTLTMSLTANALPALAADNSAEQNGSTQTPRVVFEGTSSEHKWALKELNPDLPSDWSSYEYLVMELRASSPQWFNLRFYTAEAVRTARMHPFSGAWIRAAVPLRYFTQPVREGFDMASMGNKPRDSFWMGTGRPPGPLNAVEGIGVQMPNPVGKPTLEIRSVRLTKEDPGDAVLEPKRLVDEFGQWIPVNWPGKAKTLDELKGDWASEDKSLQPGDFNYCKYGGYLGTKAKASGFFRVEEIDGRWWFVDPDGHLFFSTGADVIVPWVGTRTERREYIFAALPPAELRSANPRADRGSHVSFHTWNLLRRFGAGWQEKWVDLTLRRMDAWGLNTIGNWSDARLGASQRKAYVVTLRGWGIESGPMGLPDVYADEFARRVDEAAGRQCAPRKDDPYLLGYFVANEPPWPGKEALLVDMILEGPETATQRELKAFLQGGDTPERRRAFVLRAFGRMLEVISGAIRKHDPNHLNLGIRFGGMPSDDVIRAARVFDVFSLNVYRTAPDPRDLEKIYQLTGRPILVGEFHFGTPGRGLAAGLVQVRDHEERGVAYRYYVENAAAHPALIGTHWFQWVDEPCTGRADGENYNIGFMDVTDRPYRDFVEGVKMTHKSLFEVHSGKTPPFSQKPMAQ